MVVLLLIAQFVAALSFDGVAGTSPRMGWDAAIYEVIAEHGYPVGDALAADYPRYAFHPVFPGVVAGVVALSGVLPSTVGPIVSLTAASLGVLVLSGWLRSTIGRHAALAVVLGLVTWPAHPVLQMGYTEGVGLLILVLLFIGLHRRQHVWAALLLFLLGLTRPLAGPVTVVVVVLLLLEFWSHRDLRRVRGTGLVAGTGVLATALWPALAGLISGDAGVYFRAHAAFSSSRSNLSPAHLMGEFPAVGLLTVLALCACSFGMAKLVPPETPMVLRAWGVVYPAYLTFASLVTPSLVRYLLLAFPLSLVLAPALRRKPVAWVAVVVLLLASVLSGQWWVNEFVPPGPSRTYP